MANEDNYSLLNDKNLTERLSIRLSLKERIILRQEAEKKRIKISNLVRLLIFQNLEGTEKDLKEFMEKSNMKIRHRSRRAVMYLPKNYFIRFFEMQLPIKALIGNPDKEITEELIKQFEDEYNLLGDDEKKLIEKSFNQFKKLKYLNHAQDFLSDKNKYQRLLEGLDK